MPPTWAGALLGIDIPATQLHSARNHVFRIVKVSEKRQSVEDVHAITRPVWGQVSNL